MCDIFLSRHCDMTAADAVHCLVRTSVSVACEVQDMNAVVYMYKSYARYSSYRYRCTITFKFIAKLIIRMIHHTPGTFTCVIVSESCNSNVQLQVSVHR